MGNAVSKAYGVRTLNANIAAVACVVKP